MDHGPSSHIMRSLVVNWAHTAVECIYALFIYRSLYCKILGDVSSLFLENLNIILAGISSLKNDDCNLQGQSEISHVQSLLWQGLLVCDFSQQNSDMIHCTSLDQNHLFLKL